MSSYKLWAGIGSRETPDDICELMTDFSRLMSSKGDWMLQSGAAPGADTAFEIGMHPDRKIIYIPWNGFQKRKVDNKTFWIPPVTKFSLSLVEKYHHDHRKLSNGAFKLMNRNCYQVLGYNLQTPVNFVICWTKGGQRIGGTSFAWAIADAYKIPVYNLGDEETLTRIRNRVRDFNESGI